MLLCAVEIKERCLLRSEARSLEYTTLSVSQNILFRNSLPMRNLWRNSYCVISLRNILLTHLLTPPRYGVSFSNTPALWRVIVNPSEAVVAFLLKAMLPTGREQ
jgi:hypothetical protein